VTGRDLRFAFVVSTAGSVMNEVLKNEFVRCRVDLVVGDHADTALDAARRRGIPNTVAIRNDGPDRFCAELIPFLQDHEIDFVFSFYTKFYSTELRSTFRDRIINFHPSLLPAFKGADGFGDTIAYDARFAGNTVEFIADVMDEGKIIMQTACPVDHTLPVAHTRHRVFEQQCQALIQVAHWLQEDRITVEGHHVVVADATFDDASFSPALDARDAVRWVPPNPFGDRASRSLV